MLQPFISVLDWFGLCVFAVTGALVASRKEMDIVGFALMGSVTGIGGGTIRDVLLGAEPVFWVKQPDYLLTCVAVAVIMFFVAHIPQSRERMLLWFDGVGLALFSVTGADRGLHSAQLLSSIFRRYSECTLPLPLIPPAPASQPPAMQPPPLAACAA